MKKIHDYFCNKSGSDYKLRKSSLLNVSNWSIFVIIVLLLTISILNTSKVYGDTNCWLGYSVNANGAVNSYYSYNVSVTCGDLGPQITATGNPGYHFDHWNDGSTANPRSDIASGVQNFTAYFISNASTYLTLTYTAGSNGSVSGTSPQSIVYNGSGSAVTANPNTNYHFDHWSDGSTQNPRSDTNVTASTNLVAIFAINKSTYTITYNAGVGGYINNYLSVSENIPAGGSGVAVFASSSAGYQFTNWSDGSTQNPRIDTSVASDNTVTANFTPNPTSFTISLQPGLNGSLNNGASNGESFNVSFGGNSPVYTTASPNTGYHFVNWSDGSTTNPRKDTNVRTGVTAEANFVSDGSTNYSLSYYPGQGGTLDGARTGYGLIYGHRCQTVAPNGNGVSVTAIPYPRYHFVNWSDGSTQNPRTDLNVTHNVVVVANFTYDPSTSTLTYVAGAGGTINNGNVTSVSYGLIPGTNGPSVTAIANTGYTFSQWSDGSTQNPRTDTNVISNHTYTASFTSGNNATSTITALTPSSNSVWTKGQTYSVNWSSTNAPVDSKVQIWLKNFSTGTFYQMAGNLSNTGSYQLNLQNDLSGNVLPIGYYYLQVKFSSTTTSTAPGLINIQNADTLAPSIPSNLNSSNITSNSVSLSWSESIDPIDMYHLTSGQSGYKIYRNGVQIGTSLTNSYSDSGLSSGTTYSYRISSYDVAGNNSNQSSPISVTINSVPPVPAVVPSVVNVTNPPISSTTYSNIPQSVDQSDLGAGYTLASDSSLSVSMIPVKTIDNVGPIGVFHADGVPDFVFSLRLNLGSTKTIKSVLFTTENRDNAAFTSSMPVNGKQVKPIVITRYAQLNKAYDVQFGPYQPGQYIFSAFVQGGTAFNSYTFTVYFTDGTYVTNTNTNSVTQNNTAQSVLASIWEALVRLFGFGN